jgi:transcriptional regulator with XRE-family HTH domain
MSTLQPLISHMRDLPILDRVRANVRRVMALPHGGKKITQQSIADAIEMSSGQMTNFLKGRYGISFDKLDPLAKALGVPASELIRSSTEPLYELTGDEARVIEYLRQWTPEVRAALIGVLDFLHARMPTDPQTARMLDYWRKLGPAERDLVMASALRLREETLPPDVREALETLATVDGTRRKNER